MKIVDILELPRLPAGQARPFSLSADREKNNLTKIILLKEGIFWRVYEKSAMQFVIPI